MEEANNGSALVTPAVEFEKDLSLKFACSFPYEKAFTRFKSFEDSETFSIEGLQASECFLKLNPSFYSVWIFRRNCLKINEEKALWKAELALIHEWSLTFGKNFQIWHHRQVVLDEILRDSQSDFDWKKEFDNLKDVFKKDAKNYHAWSFTIWMLETAISSRLPIDFDLLLQYSQELIKQDPYNNSAWNFRFYLLNAHFSTTVNYECVFVAEVDCALKLAEKYLDNESVWSFLAALMRLNSCHLSQENFEKLRSIKSRFNPLLDANEKIALLKSSSSGLISIPQEKYLSFMTKNREF